MARRSFALGLTVSLTLLTWAAARTQASAWAQTAVPSNTGPSPTTAAAPNATAPWSLEALTRLEAWVAQQHGALSAQVLDLETGRSAQSHAELPLNPASNMKLVTASFALDKLGANHTYRTALFGAVGTDGAAQRLVLRGDGDPTLTEADLWRLANTLRHRGVKRVERLLVDQSAFDAEHVPPAFEQQPKEWASFRAPVSALAVERNSVTLNVLPQQENTPARVWFEPAGAVDVQGQVDTTARGGGQNIQLTLTPGPNGRLTATLAGHIAVGLSRQRFPKRVDSPDLVAGYVLAQALRDLGISVDHIERGVVRDLPLLTYVTSEPLSQVLFALGKQSDNFSAEMVFKSLSSTSHGVASFAASSALAEEWLRQQLPLPAGTHIVNGSGLFDANRLSASTLVTLLANTYADPRRRDVMLAQLSVGGNDGTLTNRFQEPETSGRVRAKTGTLDESVALSGYLLREGTRPPLVFSMVVNGIAGKHSEVRRLLDAVVSELARNYR